jgi:hypothetical protein
MGPTVSSSQDLSSIQSSQLTDSGPQVRDLYDKYQWPHGPFINFVYSNRMFYLI